MPIHMVLDEGGYLEPVLTTKAKGELNVVKEVGNGQVLKESKLRVG